MAASADDLRDRQLVEAVRRNEPRAWHELLTRYQDRLFGVCVRILGPSPRNRDIATDLTQEAMVKIIQGINSYDGSAKVSTWMIRVTMNVCLSYLRGQKLRRHTSLDATAPTSTQTDGAAGPSLRELLETREPGAAQRVSHQQTRAMVAEALNRLDAEQRAILVLRDVQGLEYDQIAQFLAVPVGTVKSRLFRARAALRDLIEKAQQ